MRIFSGPMQIFSHGHEDSFDRISDFQSTLKRKAGSRFFIAETGFKFIDMG